MVTSNNVSNIVHLITNSLSHLDESDGKVDYKTSISIFNDFAEANGLQKIEGRSSDTEQIDLEEIKALLIQKYCEGIEGYDDDIKNNVDKLEYKKLETLIKNDVVQPLPPKFGI